LASEIRKFSLDDFKINDALGIDDDWLSAAVSSLAWSARQR
jgi:hypothetical protein